MMNNNPPLLQLNNLFMNTYPLPSPSNTNILHNNIQPICQTHQNLNLSHPSMHQPSLSNSNFMNPSLFTSPYTIPHTTTTNGTPSIQSLHHLLLMTRNSNGNHQPLMNAPMNYRNLNLMSVINNNACTPTVIKHEYGMPKIEDDNDDDEEEEENNEDEDEEEEDDDDDDVTENDNESQAIQVSNTSSTTDNVVVCNISDIDNNLFRRMENIKNTSHLRLPSNIDGLQTMHMPEIAGTDIKLSNIHRIIQSHPPMNTNKHFIPCNPFQSSCTPLPIINNYPQIPMIDFTHSSFTNMPVLSQLNTIEQKRKRKRISKKQTDDDDEKKRKKRRINIIDDNLETDFTMGMDGRYSCLYCHKNYKNKCHLQRHTREQHSLGSPSFECRICGKKFNQRSNLKVHLRSHALDESISRPWLCKECYPHRRFTRKSSLKRHWITKHKTVAKLLIDTLEKEESLAEQMLNDTSTDDDENSNNYMISNTFLFGVKNESATFDGGYRISDLPPDICDQGSSSVSTVVSNGHKENGVSNGVNHHLSFDNICITQMPFVPLLPSAITFQNQ